MKTNKKAALWGLFVDPLFICWWDKQSNSEEQIKAFDAKVQADTNLQEQLKIEGAGPVAIAQTAGLSITQEDIKAYFTELEAVDEDRELNLDELQSVAGGSRLVQLKLAGHKQWTGAS